MLSNGDRRYDAINTNMSSAPMPNIIHIDTIFTILNTWPYTMLYNNKHGINDNNIPIKPHIVKNNERIYKYATINININDIIANSKSSKMYAIN